jgi:serine/threonine protein kinase
MEEILKKYKMEKQIGKGTQGTVYLATVIETGEKVAIKQVLCPDEKTLTSIIAEIELVLGLSHKNIIKYIEYFKDIQKDEYTEEETVCVYLVSELCQVPLSNVLKEMRDKREIFDAKVLLSWMRQIVSAIRYLTENDIMHRDIKPDNILICNEGIENREDWVMKLIDFGCAVPGTEREGMVGTVGYMAPEIMTEKYSVKVDVYSLGAVLYEMLTLKDIELLRKDLTHMLLHHTFIKTVLKGYQSFFIDLITMSVSRNVEKRAPIKDMESFINKNAPYAVKSGPVISREALTLLNARDDEEDALEDFKSDAEKLKEVLRESNKSAKYTPNVTTPTPTLSPSTNPTPGNRQSRDVAQSFMQPRDTTIPESLQKSQSEKGFDKRASRDPNKKDCLLQ